MTQLGEDFSSLSHTYVIVRERDFLLDAMENTEIILTLVFEKEEEIFTGYIEGSNHSMIIRGSNLLKVRNAVFTYAGQFIRTLPRPTKVRMYTRENFA